MKPLFVVTLFLTSVAVYGQSNKSERDGEPDIYAVDSDDEEMNSAIRKSRETFSEFLAILKNPKSNQGNFSVKMPFRTTEGAEHLWLIDIELKDGKVFGKIDNVPQDVLNVKLGDRYEIQKEKLSDWFYIEGNRLVGGLTIRVLRDRMSPQERQEFDRSFGVRFN
jgi:uncharacterized protein YegJ (DUF2314 family)